MTTQTAPKLPYIDKATRPSGKVVYYARRYARGRRIRLPDTPNTPLFLTSYAKAIAELSSQADPRPRKAKNRHLIGWLINEYLTSAAYNKNQPSTQKYQLCGFKKIREKWETARFDRVTSKDIKRKMNDLQHTPEAANQLLKTFRALVKWALYVELIDRDPTTGVSYYKHNTDGFYSWADKDFERFTAAFALGTQERLAFELLASTGARVGDVIQLGPEDLKAGIIRYTSRKSKTPVSIRATQGLEDALTASQASGDTFLTLPTTGEPFHNSKAFYQWFKKRCAQAGVDGSAHGIRKGLATRAAEQGASTMRLMALFGWKTSKMAELYTQKADREKIGLESSGYLERI
ncbi:tyrosine-type recombinase/integrase [Flexibacterium corallicola]|uniref:tyrosine-type recombinase/integrase n=1 Tax=Flexibacterium corallicola TaxID=3037259 RepID=UPI00286F8FBC|nr:tyrosine-type recombinase/integrase [Pseudovibrio sp. M1P-2-3]